MLSVLGTHLCAQDCPKTPYPCVCVHEICDGIRIKYVWTSNDICVHEIHNVFVACECQCVLSIHHLPRLVTFDSLRV